MNGHGLVGIEGAAASAVEGLRNGCNGVTGGALNKGEVVSGIGATSQICRDLASVVRAFRSTGGGGWA